MHPELKPLAIYHRHQRSRQGPYSEAEAVPAGISLLELPPPPAAGCSVPQQQGPPPSQQQQETHMRPQQPDQQQEPPLSCRSLSLESLATGPRPLVLLAGSWS
jgi:hypothetical protein